MAVFDRDNAKIVVRVVYDGPGNAGKTTNLTEMCQFFTSRRRSELLSPEARDGRTMWFDWLQIDAGLVAGYGLRCQIVTVPGQVVLRRRRSALLRSADVVVMVCDSTPAGLELVRPAFGRIRQFVAEQAGADVPIVVQANKQDLAGALAPEDLAAALGADGSIPIVAARANAGLGVKETLVLAIRAAANRAQQLVLERGIEAMTGEPDAADAVLAELRRLDDDHGQSLEELLEQPTFIDDRPPEAVRMPAIPPPPLPPLRAATAPPPANDQIAPPPPRAIAAPVPITEVDTAPIVVHRELRTLSAVPVAPPTSDDKIAPVAAPRPAPASVPPIVAPAPAPASVSPTVAPAPASPTSSSGSLSSWPLPPLRDATIAPGNLWPAATGREVLRRLAQVRPRPRHDLVAQLGDHDGSGKASAVIYDADGWCLKTSTSRRFEDLDAARVALVKLARTKIALGSLTLSSTVLVMSSDASGGYWVWTFAPWRTTLRAAMTAAMTDGDPARLGDALTQFAAAVTEALVRALRAGQGLDLHPSNFALDGEALVYLDDDVVPAPPVPGAAHAILQRAEELQGYPAAIERYAASLIEQIPARLTGEDLARLRLVDELRATTPRAAPARALRMRLLAVLDPSSVTAESLEPPAPVAVEPAPVIESWPLPPRAAEQLPSGYIWPVIAGRELVRQILNRTPTRRDGLPFTYELGDYLLSTSSERRFIEVDDARAELLRLARAHVARGVAWPGVVLVLAPDDARGGHWIWTIAPIADEASAPP
jgi:signal recognition particle receptor subunit beta